MDYPHDQTERREKALRTFAEIERDDSENRLSHIDQEGLDALPETLAMLPTEAARELYLRRAQDHERAKGAVTELLALRGLITEQLVERGTDTGNGSAERKAIMEMLGSGLEAATTDLQRSGEDIRYARGVAEAYAGLVATNGPDDAIRHLRDGLDESPEWDSSRVTWFIDFVTAMAAEPVEE